MTRWRKSAHSGASNNTDCVELASLIEGVGIRDSKDPQQRHLVIEPESFTELVNRIKAGRLDT